MSGAELRRLPIGAVGAALTIGPDDVRAERLAIPVLTGLMTLSDLRIRNTPEGIAWQVHGELSPVPLDLLLAHFGLPPMQGTVSGEIPLLRHERSTLQVDGQLVMRVFDGVVTVTDLAIDQPLGLAPRLHAHLDARALDLERITRTFSFGYMTGKVDARVTGLVLSDWTPVQFDARLESSPGDYPKRISQAAVKSISALGGADATAALQRTFLRAFKTLATRSSASAAGCRTTSAGWAGSRICRRASCSCGAGASRRSPWLATIARSGGPSSSHG